jgi:hypothetical protein
MTNNTNLSDLELASFLQRYILVHSRLYYETNNTIIDDRKYDLKSKQLVELQKKIDVTKTDYGYIFHDFDGTTGFDLFERLSETDKEKIDQVINHVLRCRSYVPLSGRK